MSTIVSAEALEAFISGVESGRIRVAPPVVGHDTLTGAETEIFVPSVSEELERFLDLLGGSHTATAGICIGAASAEHFDRWIEATIGCATILLNQVAKASDAIAAGSRALGREAPDVVMSSAVFQLTAVRRYIASRSGDGDVFLSPADVAFLQEALGEIVVQTAELELDMRAWRLRRRAGRGFVKDLRREAPSKAEAPAAAERGETVSECLGAVADFMFDYTGTGCALAAVTVVEFEALFRDLAKRVRALEAARPTSAAGAVAWDAIARAVNDPEGNVELFPVVRRTPPRDPVPAA